ncbi:MAG: TetR/AcrR family transcriptional regulator [Luminiphilus sp.]|nr:TetR/AcrR family transcriptional regulator [Luminiphilus sp.]
MSSDRKVEILRAAIELIADEGYGSLSMRALARASGMKLGALQYHFRTWDALLVAFVAYIESEIISAFESGVGELEQADIGEMIEFMLDEHVGTADGLFSDRLWAQLWAMEQVEPLVSDLLEELYAKFLTLLEDKLRERGAAQPRAEALVLLSMVEGESLFSGSGRRWEKDRAAVRRSILQLLDERYGAS